jgi:hypothetical protein
VSESGDDVRGLQRRGLAGLLEAAASLALDQPAEASAALDRRERATQALVERRLDRLAPNLAMVQVQMLERRAQIELLPRARSAVERADPSQANVLAAARRAHVFSLQAQSTVTREWLRISPDGRGRRLGARHADRRPLSPWRLLLSNPELAALPAERSLELERQLLVALASVAPLEVPASGHVARCRGVEPGRASRREPSSFEATTNTAGEPATPQNSVDPRLVQIRAEDPERMPLLDAVGRHVCRSAEAARRRRRAEPARRGSGARAERLGLFRLEARQLEAQAEQVPGQFVERAPAQALADDAALTLCEG